MPPACFVKLVAACSGPCSGPQPEKRLGVTKNGIATVDLVCTCEGEQRFFEDYKKLASFREDPVIATAVERIHEKLGQDAPCQEMQMGGM